MPVKNNRKMNRTFKCLVDTNVPLTANKALTMDDIDDIPSECVLACVRKIETVVSRGRLVLDDGDEIFNEYRRKLNLSGQPGVGDKFVKWVHDIRYNSSICDQVTITEYGDSYLEFPDHDDLTNFDISDRKFIATANAHHEKPPILQAVDSKWWKWKDALNETGITVQFLCLEYVKKKCQEKIGT